ncbi:hypothetical protein CLV35_1450 [Motilibacter peucedani]|uniref:Uncharacterized protein n=1 Tax=Motilibacter peucedani TaxID=598650 RepID=A0A420XS92_9ACTN|nr:DUF4148 domain-containing protein [Motilibacter peucedani]RKS77752.1 hypothetical protein CLV35_1450 [Motilibacter peucedani]
MRSLPARLSAVAITAAALLSVAGPASAHGGEGTDGPAPGEHLTNAQRHAIVEATRQFKDLHAAEAAGYVPASECTELPGVGGMGVHYLNPAYASDAVVDPLKPEVLVYYPTKHGRLRLGAVEYFVADADQDLATDDDRPSLLGHEFNGPMPGHSADMPIHYDLHIWLYEKNPLGQLQPWNPDVSCAGS